MFGIHNVDKNNNGYELVPKKSATLGSYLKVRNLLIGMGFMIAATLTPKASQLIGNTLEDTQSENTADSSQTESDFEKQVDLIVNGVNQDPKSNSSISQPETSIVISSDKPDTNESPAQSTSVTITSSVSSSSSNGNTSPSEPKVTLNGEDIDLPKNGRYREKTDDGFTETDVKLDIDIDNNSNTSFKINTNVGGD